MNNKPLFIKGDKLYASFNGSVIGGTMTGANPQNLVIISIGETELIGCATINVFHSRHEAEVKNHGVGSDVYYYPVKGDKLTQSRITSFREKLTDKGHRYEKRLIAGIEGGFEIHANALFTTKLKAMETPKLTNRKHTSNGYVDTCRMTPRDTMIDVVFQNYIIKELPTFFSHMN